MTTLFKDQVTFETYGETITAGQPVYKSTGTGNDSSRVAGYIYKLDVSNSDRKAFYGIAKDSGIALDANKRVVNAGRAEGFSGLTAGLPVYADSLIPGGITQTKPTSNIQAIGTAQDHDTVFVNSALAGTFLSGEGGGGVGGVDIFFVQDFESAVLNDFTHTGLTLSLVSPLKGKVSALLTHDSSINQSFKEVKPVAEKFRGRNMLLELNLKSLASAGNVTISVYDETNAASIVAATQLTLSSSVGGVKDSIGFRIPETCESISYTITALPEAGSPTTRIDDIICQINYSALIETSVEVPNLTAWQSYIPTFQGFGTAPTGPTNIQFEWRQVGENIEIRGKFNSGTSTAVEARIGLPTGLISASTSIIPSLQLVGKGNRGNGGTLFFGGTTVLIEPSVSYMTLSLEASTIYGTTKQNGSVIASSGELLTLFASVPCAGLSAVSTKTIPLTQSALVQEEDGYLRITGFTSSLGSSATRIISLASGVVQQDVGDAIQYLDDSINGARFIAQKQGLYRFEFSADVNTVAGVGIGFSKNTASTTTNFTSLAASEKIATGYDSGSNQIVHTFGEAYLNVGDVIRIHADTAGALTSPNSSWSTFTASYQGSLKQLHVSSDQKITIPTSELRFEGASARGTVDTAIVRFAAMTSLRGDAFEINPNGDPALYGTHIKAVKAGKINVSVSAAHSATNSLLVISKNQSVRIAVPSLASEVMATSQAYTTTATSNSSAEFDVQAGDIIRVACSSTPTASSNNTLHITFQEQEVSVSVTNTLPQFSESDSYVRVATGAGFGSTATSTRRFSAVSSNIGSDIAYVDSPTLGGRFTVRSAGIYHISYTDSSSSTTPSIYVMINGVTNVANATISTATGSAVASASIYLSENDVITFQSTVTGINPTSAVCYAEISKVGKPNVTGVDVTPFAVIPQANLSAWKNGGAVRITSTGTSPSKGTVAVDYMLWRQVGEDYEVEYNFRQTTAGGAGTGEYILSLPAGVEFDSSIALYTGAFLSDTAPMISSIIPGGFVGNSANGGGDAYMVPYTSTSFRLLNTDWYAAANPWSTTFYTMAGVLAIRGVFKFKGKGLTLTSDSIVTEPEIFSTDTASLQYSSSYSLSTLNTAPIGTYITFTYAANSNTRTQTSTRPTQTDADMNANGMLIYPRAYNVPSTAAQPACIAIQIGKGLKGCSLGVYKTAGKVLAGNVDFFPLGSTQDYGMKYKDYNESTGILYLDAGACSQVSVTLHQILFSDDTGGSSAYVTINASKNPALTGVNSFLPKVAVLKDVKASGVAAQSIGTVYAARILNTIEGDTSFVINSSSFTGTGGANSQFTLSPGQYRFKGTTHFYSGAGAYHGKTRLYNVTNASVVTTGLGTYAAGSSGDDSMAVSISEAVFSIGTNTTFEFQHRINTSTRFGGYANTFGDEEVHAICEIEKLK